MSFVERQEGREFARAMFESIQRYPDVFFAGNGVETMIENLEATLDKRPGDYAEGIEEILCIARSATGEGK